jgi:hypothetical protein
MTTRLDRIHQEAIENEELLEGLIDRKGLEALIRVARAAKFYRDCHQSNSRGCQCDLCETFAPLLEEVK